MPAIDPNPNSLSEAETKLTCEVIRELLDYDPETGIFIWKPRERKWFRTNNAYRTWNTRFAGKQALTANIRGYRVGAVLNSVVNAHRLAWLYVHGRWPKGHIDHINSVRGDNRIINLREATRAENRWNSKMMCNNTSGLRGVRLYPHGRWRARIYVNGRFKHLGYFNTPEAAYGVYCLVAAVRRGAFARFD